MNICCTGTKEAGCLDKLPSGFSCSAECLRTPTNLIIHTETCHTTKDRLCTTHNFVKKNFVCIGCRDNIMSWQDVTHSSLCSHVKECGTKCAHSFLFPRSSFRIQRTTVLGIFKYSAIILDVIQWSFLTKSTTAAMFTSG